MNEKEIKYYSKIIPIYELISEKKLVIPPYQRTFSWKHNDIIDLLNTIYSKATKTPNDEMWLGAVLIDHTHTANNKSKNYLVDGQQRLTSLMIILKLLECDKIIKKVENNFEIEFAINDVYENTITALDIKNYLLGTTTNKKINKLIKAILKYINKEKSDLLVEDHIKQKIISYIKEKIKVTQVNVDNEGSKYFMNLNTKGKPLDLFQQCMSYIFSNENENFINYVKDYKDDIVDLTNLYKPIKIEKNIKSDKELNKDPRVILVTEIIQRFLTIYAGSSKLTDYEKFVNYCESCSEGNGKEKNIAIFLRFIRSYKKVYRDYYSGDFFNLYIKFCSWKTMWSLVTVLKERKDEVTKKDYENLCKFSFLLNLGGLNNEISSHMIAKTYGTLVKEKEKLIFKSFPKEVKNRLVQVYDNNTIIRLKAYETSGENPSDEVDDKIAIEELIKNLNDAWSDITMQNKKTLLYILNEPENSLYLNFDTIKDYEIEHIIPQKNDQVDEIDKQKHNIYNLLLVKDKLNKKIGNANLNVKIEWYKNNNTSIHGYSSEPWNEYERIIIDNNDEQVRIKKFWEERQKELWIRWNNLANSGRWKLKIGDN